MYKYFMHTKYKYTYMCESILTLQKFEYNHDLVVIVFNKNMIF